MAPEFKTHCEQLEDRTTPANFGVPWLDPTLLTISFANDKTAIVDHESNLFESLNSVAGTTQWQMEILRAFQTWAVHGNVNLSIVTDSGDAFGTSGQVQHDPRFGDIRIGGFAQSAEVLAVALPPDLFSGTWSGDVFLNTSYQFGIGDQAMLDLFSVLVHEAGHVFGLPGNNDPDSVMNQSYEGLRTGLSTADIAAFQSLYGARVHDAYEGTGGNNTLQTATSFTGQAQVVNNLYLVDADVTTLDDVDFYKIRPTGNTSEMTIRLRTNGVSLLTPKLSIYDFEGNLVTSVVADGPLDDDLFINLSDLAKNKDYFIKVESAVNDVFGIGSYKLEINLDPENIDPDEYDAVYSDSDLLQVGEGKQKPAEQAFAAAAFLKQKDGIDDGMHYLVKSSTTDASDLDMYKLKSPMSDASVMTITIRNTDATGLLPNVTVYNAQRNEVSHEVLVNADGSYTVQINDIEENQFYFIAVTSAEDGSGTGEYFLGVDFGTTVHTLDDMTSGSLTAEASSEELSLVVKQNQLFHFVLGAEGAGETAVRMTVSDAQGNLLFTLQSAAGQVHTANLFLASGTYQVRFEKLGDSDANYQLRGLAVTDPIGPQPEDITQSPVTSTPTADANYVFVAPTSPPTTPGPAPDPAGPGSGGSSDSGSTGSGGSGSSRSGSSGSGSTGSGSPGSTITPGNDWLAAEDPYSNPTWTDLWTSTPSTGMGSGGTTAGISGSKGSNSGYTQTGGQGGQSSTGYDVADPVSSVVVETDTGDSHVGGGGPVQTTSTATNAKDAAATGSNSTTTTASSDTASTRLNNTVSTTASLSINWTQTNIVAATGSVIRSGQTALVNWLTQTIAAINAAMNASQAADADSGESEANAPADDVALADAVPVQSPIANLVVVLEQAQTEADNSVGDANATTQWDPMQAFWEDADQGLENDDAAETGTLSSGVHQILWLLALLPFLALGLVLHRPALEPNFDHVH